MKRAWAVLLACAALPAKAHEQSVSVGEVDVSGDRVAARLRFAASDLAASLRLEQGPDGTYKQSGVDAVLPALLHLTLDEYAVATPDGPCARDAGGRAEVEGDDGIVVAGSWTCPRAVEALSVRAGFLEVLPPGHAHLAKVTFPGGRVSQRMVQADSPRFEVGARASFWAAAGRFLRLGIEHIFTGYDHIAFLTGLLLLGGTVRELVKIVTAFTVAHSITLALAALSVVTPPPRLVEPLIAASIVFIGVENLWALRTKHAAQALRHRWMVTFAFGLVHGFGFASVLRELDLPRAVLATGLVSFNLGVECGQVAIVLAALPVLKALLRKWSPFAPAASACVSLLGALWLVQRLLG
jgi:hydrogenase/urease accessory protein HupE